MTLPLLHCWNLVLEQGSAHQRALVEAHPQIPVEEDGSLSVVASSNHVTELLLVVEMVVAAVVVVAGFLAAVVSDCEMSHPVENTMQTVQN